MPIPNINSAGTAAMVVLVAILAIEMSQGASSDIMSGKRVALQKRLQQELRELQKDPPPGVKVDIDGIMNSNDMTRWIVDIEGPENCLVQGKHFKLQFKFGPNYPFVAPDVRFIGPKPGVPHISRAGYICISIFGYGWSPAYTVRSVSLSIISFIGSYTKKGTFFGLPIAW